jgi:hypothetical protein
MIVTKLGEKKRPYALFSFGQYLIFSKEKMLRLKYEA